MDLRTRRPAGWQAENWQMHPAEIGMAGKEERGLGFDCKQSWVRFLLFVFKMVKQWCVCGCSSRPRQEEPGPRISSDERPTRSCFVRSPWSQGHRKNIQVCGLIFPKDGAPLPQTFSWTSIGYKKNQKQRKPAAESWSPAKISADPQSVCPYRTAAWSSSSRSLASSVTGQLQVYPEEQT